MCTIHLCVKIKVMQTIYWFYFYNIRVINLRNCIHPEWNSSFYTYRKVRRSMLKISSRPTYLWLQWTSALFLHFLILGPDMMNILTTDTANLMTNNNSKRGLENKHVSFLFYWLLIKWVFTLVNNLSIIGIICLSLWRWKSLYFFVEDIWHTIPNSGCEKVVFMCPISTSFQQLATFGSLAKGPQAVKIISPSSHVFFSRMIIWSNEWAGEGLKLFPSNNL